jgi:hypothetical protein
MNAIDKDFATAAVALPPPFASAPAPARGPDWHPLAWWGAAAAAWALICLPLLLVDVPPLTDYPNHLARMDVLANMARVPFLASVYEARWSVIPDLAIDSFMPWVVSVVPVHTAGRMLLALILLLDVAGAAACAAVLHGRRTWWSLGAALAAHNVAFLMGFLNFNLTLGAGMLLAAAWIRLRQRTPAPVAAAFGFGTVGLLFFGHLMGLFFHVVLIGSYEASLLWQRLRRCGWRPQAACRAVLASWPVALAAVPLAVLYPLSGLHGVPGDRSTALCRRCPASSTTASRSTRQPPVPCSVSWEHAGCWGASAPRPARCSHWCWSAACIRWCPRRSREPPLWPHGLR